MKLAALRERVGWRIIAVVIAGVSWGTWGHGAENSAREIEAIYQPFRVAQGSLAPEGDRVAFLVRDRSRFSVELFDTSDLLAKKQVTLAAGVDARPAFFAWASSSLLVVAFDIPLIVTIDAHRGESTTLVDRKSFPSSKTLRRTLRPLMLAGDTRGQLILELATADGESGNVGVELVQLDLRTGTHEIRPVRKFEFPGGELLVDRQGQPRIVRPLRERTQRFFLRSDSARNVSWRPLDQVCTESTPLNFFVSPENFLGERSVPLGFDADPNLLYFASNVGRNTRGVFALDVRSGRRTDFVIDDPEFDLVDARLSWGGSPLVFDRARGNLIGLRSHETADRVRWFDREIRAVEQSLQRQFPGREIQALDWDDERRRFLVWVGSNGDPGRYFVYDGTTERCTEYFRRHPGLKTANLNPSEPFACGVGSEADNIRGYLTRPHTTVAKKPPLVIWLHDGPGVRSASGFNRDAQALAAMGFAVAQIDYVGSGGYGLAWQNALQDQPDEAPRANLTTVIRWLDSRGLIDVKRVAVVGEGLGGYLALRALENEPELLRSVVAINAPMSLGDLAIDREAEQASRDAFTAEVMSRVGRPRPTSPEEIEAQWQRESEARTNAAIAAGQQTILQPVDFQKEFYSSYFKRFKKWRDASVLPGASRLTKPVMLLHDPSQRYVPIAPVRELYAGLQRRKQNAAFAEIPPQFALGSLEAREEVVRRIGEFLNVTLYDFDVKLGETQEVK